MHFEECLLDAVGAAAYHSGCAPVADDAHGEGDRGRARRFAQIERDIRTAQPELDRTQAGGRVRNCVAEQDRGHAGRTVIGEAAHVLDDAVEAGRIRAERDADIIGRARAHLAPRMLEEQTCGGDRDAAHRIEPAELHRGDERCGVEAADRRREVRAARRRVERRDC